MTKKTIFRTWDNWCLFKLKEIGRSTFKQWATALNYKTPSSMKKIVERLTEAGKLNVKKTGRLGVCIYEVKEDVI